jgi:ABC-type transporter Mla MlaB component
MLPHLDTPLLFHPFGPGLAIYEFMLIDQTPLRITFLEGKDVLTMKIEGKVTGSQVDELSRVWRSVGSSLGRRRLVIDLHDLIFVDRAGVAALAEICGQTGAQFDADTPLTKYFAEEALYQAIEDSKMKGAA